MILRRINIKCIHGLAISSFQFTSHTVRFEAYFEPHSFRISWLVWNFDGNDSPEIFPFLNKVSKKFLKEVALKQNSLRSISEGTFLQSNTFERFSKYFWIKTYQIIGSGKWTGVFMLANFCAFESTCYYITNPSTGEICKELYMDSIRVQIVNLPLK